MVTNDRTDAFVLSDSLELKNIPMRNKINDHITHWPADGFENVLNCPACGALDRKILHEELTDRVFFTAPGKWSMYQCKSCASAYLDPRPTVESIGLAYQRYITHDAVPSYDSLGWFEKIRYRLANGYRNHRYGTRDVPASILGIIAASMSPKGRAIIDAGMRHLPSKTGGGRLLDIGCGNGVFLSRAEHAGWDVVGLDVDSKAVETARCLGLDVRLGGIESMDATDPFDIITLAHVIEHVHHPLEVLRTCNQLLRPDGFLWIETPNIGALGHRLFGDNWRGLEPPRHLIIFNLQSMYNTLNAAGFTKIEIQPYRPNCDFIFNSSMAIWKNTDPYSVSQRFVPLHIVKKAERIARLDPAQREFITVKAWKR